MKFNTIQQIQAHQFIGNHHSDHLAFTAIESFVQRSTTSLKDQAEALRVMGDEGMGLGREEHITDQELVDSYLDNM
jgi:hypothetical protein